MVRMVIATIESFSFVGFSTCNFFKWKVMYYLDQVCSGRCRLIFSLHAHLYKRSRTEGFLINSFVWVWFLSNLEWLLILEEDTDSPKECKALILTILSMINVILKKYESLTDWIHSTFARQKQQNRNNTCSLNAQLTLMKVHDWLKNWKLIIKCRRALFIELASISNGYTIKKRRLKF